MIVKQNQRRIRPEEKLSVVLVILVILFAVFSLGFFVSYVLLKYTSYNIEKPFSSAISEKAAAPSDFIKEDDIAVYSDRVVIRVSNASLSYYAPTNSMTPTFDSGANGIRIRPSSAEDIWAGDIVTYESGQGLIVHRVIEIGSDDEGIYFITKGDNNPSSDGKIRFSQIRYKTIGIFY